MTTHVFEGGGATLACFFFLFLFCFNCIPLLERVEVLPGPTVGSQEGSRGFSPSKPLRSGLANIQSQPGLCTGEERTGIVTG